jgi:hypothetical protein
VGTNYSPSTVSKDYTVIASGQGSHSAGGPSTFTAASFIMPDMALGDVLHIELECIPTVTGSVDISNAVDTPNPNFSTSISAATEMLIGTLVPTVVDITVARKATLLWRDGGAASGSLSDASGITFNGGTKYIILFHAVGGVIEYRYLVAKIKKN